MQAVVENSIGILRLSGSERIFAIDGQHRVEGIKAALIEKTSLKDEQQVAILVAHDSQSAAGVARTRRLFSTLNRYAKPVSKGDIIALDEDNAIAITTREMIEHHPLLSKPGAMYLSREKAKQVPATDRTAITSVATLYDLLDAVLLMDQEHKKSGPTTQF